MTFKHVKFEDSPIMRSLEKVAKEKGLVKPEPLKKTASPKLDISPTDNLMENIFKLCAGLRTEGLHKYADELEVNYLTYKKAQTLYETSKEKGDDLVHAAHPKGSHKLEDVDSSEAVVEDILDHQLKMMEVVNKKPSGKLSTAAALKAVKTILGQNTKTAPVTNKSVYDLCNEAWAQYNGAVSRIQLEVEVDKSYYNDVVNNLSNPTLEGLKEAQEAIMKTYYFVKPTSLVSIYTHPFYARSWTKVSEENWKIVEPMLMAAYNAIGAAITQLINSGQSAPPPRNKSVDMSKFDKEQKESQQNTDALSAEIASTMDKINGWLYLPQYKNIQSSKSLVDWINKEHRLLGNLLSDSHSENLYDQTLRTFQQEKQYIQDVESKYTRVGS